MVLHILTYRADAMSQTWSYTLSQINAFVPDEVFHEFHFTHLVPTDRSIETLAWAHERTPLANLIRWRDKPVALSIVQARLVGLAHFSVGYIFTYAAFLIASTSGKFG